MADFLGPFALGFALGVMAMYFAWENRWFSYSTRKGLPYSDIWRTDEND